MKQQDEKDLWGIFLFRFLVLCLALTTVVPGRAFSGTTPPSDIAQVPLLLTQSAKPKVMLALSRDHQLYIKAYTDYSDLDNNGSIDTTYLDTFDYYGYFDSAKCYTYSSGNGRYEPSAAATGTNKHECDGSTWSGNFLNWATMTRIDVLRKVLYGGYRSTDISGETVLERTLLPKDIHAFAKVYAPGNSTLMKKFTPYAENSLSICNVTWATSGDSNTLSTTTYPPRMRIAKGAWPTWAASESVQCAWRSEQGNATAKLWTPDSGTDKLAENNVKVKVCVSGLSEDNCRQYPNGNLKPAGLLQTYGENASLYFGLMTGSYQKNKSGGVLRRNINQIAGNTVDTTKNEIDLNTGLFINQGAGSQGIINTINRLRIAGYSFANQNYNQNCSSAGKMTFVDGECIDWGNPLGEMYYETLRYFSGQTTPTTAFNANDTGYIAGLPTATWVDPIPSGEYCATNSVVLLSTGLNSFDTDQLGTLLDPVGNTNAVGTVEAISGDYLIGQTPSNDNDQCTAKTVTNLSDAMGICPEIPQLEGGYQLAGMAYKAHTTDVRPSDRTGTQTVETFSFALAETLPRFEVGGVTLLPSCQANSSANATSTSTGWRQCNMINVNVLQMITDGSGDLVKGRIQVQWEDTPFGSDSDMDGVSEIEFCLGPTHCGDNTLSSSQVKVTTKAVQAFAGHALRFGYVITGSTTDGSYLDLIRTGGQNFSLLVTPAVNQSTADKFPPVSRNFMSGSSAAKLLENPLWYAAKWGRFTDQNGSKTPDLTSEWDADGDGLPDDYFPIKNPGLLNESLNRVFASVAATTSSAAATAANSTSLQTDTLVFQARFNSADWHGDLLAFNLDQTSGAIGDQVWSAEEELPSTRKLFTYDPAKSGTKGISLVWSSLSTAQKDYLDTSAGGSVDGLGSQRLDYLRGSHGYEMKNGGIFRNRTSLLGDIVNSGPLYMGKADLRYQGIAGEGTSYNAFRASATYKNRASAVFVGANDGMFHCFNAETGEELFAYVPNLLLPNLSRLTSPSYGTTSLPHYFFVDGAAKGGDAYFGGQWHSVVVGSTGAGGKGVFALDVTDPGAFDAGKVLWEITPDFVDPVSLKKEYAELGYTLGQPTIVRLKNGVWAALFANGYSSASGKAMLYLADLADGHLIKAFDLGNGPSNGLSSPTPVDTNNDRIVDVIYAGDLKGNLWKIDVSDISASKWDVAFKSGTSPAPLYIARGPAAEAQPITVRPEVGKMTSFGGGYLVYFGTGKYHSSGDEVLPAAQSARATQSFYTIWDEGTKISATDRSVLVAQTVTDEIALTSRNVRLISQNAVTYGNSVKGWYLDLVSPVNGKEGERILSKALLRSGRVIFASMMPSSSSCDFGGSSWLYELDAQTGKRITKSVFDINDDGKIDTQDEVTTKDNSGNDIEVPVSGVGSTEGVIQTPGAVIEIPGTGTEIKISSGSTGGFFTQKESFGDDSGLGRRTWRQLR